MSRLGRNARSLLIQGIVSALSQLFVYKVLITRAGTANMGAWAVIMAVTGFAGIAGAGISAGVVREISIAGVKGSLQKSQVVTAALCLTLVYNFVLFWLLYYGGTAYIQHTLSGAYFADLQSVLLLTLVSLMIGSIGNVFLSVLDGSNLFAKRALIVSIGYLFYAISSGFLISSYGLRGLSYSLCAQSIFILITTLVYLLYHRILLLNGIALVRSQVKTLFGYGTSLQLINVIMLFFDPITKYFITQSAGLTGVGYYEMANRLVMQVRNMVVGTSQVLVPRVATFNKTAAELSDFLVQFFKLNMNIALLVALTISGFSWVVSIFWLNKVDNLFILALMSSNIGWFVNTMSAPAYYYYLGKGRLNANIVQHIFFALITVVLFMIVPVNADSSISFVIPAIALIVGSMYLVWVFSRSIKVSMTELIDHRLQLVTGILILSAIIYLLVFSYLPGLVYSILFTAFVVSVMIFLVIKQKLVVTARSIFKV